MHLTMDKLKLSSNSNFEQFFAGVFFLIFDCVFFSPKIANSIDQGIKSFLLFIMEAHRSRGHVDTARLLLHQLWDWKKYWIGTGFSENSAAEYCRMKNSLNRGAYARHQTMDEIHQKGALSLYRVDPPNFCCCQEPVHSG